MPSINGVNCILKTHRDQIGSFVELYSTRMVSPSSVALFTTCLPTADVDYTSVSMILTIPAGSPNLTCVLVPIVPDTLSENCGNEVFGINLTAVSPRVTIENGSAIIEIIDDDLPGGKLDCEVAVKDLTWLGFELDDPTSQINVLDGSLVGSTDCDVNVEPTTLM